MLSLNLKVRFIEPTLRHIKLRLFRDLSTLKVKSIEPIVWKLVFFYLFRDWNSKEMNSYIHLEKETN